MRHCDGFARRRSDLRFETRDFVQHHVGTDAEIARVPEIAVLNERGALDVPHFRIDRERLAEMETAEAGRRRSGAMPKETISQLAAATPDRPQSSANFFHPRRHGRWRAPRRS